MFELCLSSKHDAIEERNYSNIKDGSHWRDNFHALSSEEYIKVILESEN